MRMLIFLPVASSIALAAVMTVVALEGVGDSPARPHRGPISSPTAAYPR